MYARGYHFNPKYKLGRWDGKIRYFKENGRTFITLLDDIIPRIIRLGYSLTLEDRRSAKQVTPNHITQDFFSDIINPNTNEPWQMRPYQVELVNVLIDNGNGVALAATGAGKTSSVAALAKSYELAGNLRSLIIVPDKNLTAQTFHSYEFFGLDVGEYSGDRKNDNHQHIVSTWQTLQHIPTFVQDFQVIIVDECHGLRGEVLTKLLTEYGKNIPYRFGVTGTLPKEESDQYAVKVAVGDVKYTITAAELQRMGYLASVHIDIFQHDINLTQEYNEYLEITNKPLTYRQFKDQYLPDFASEKKFLMEHSGRNEWISDYIKVKRDLKRGNILCLVNGVKYGKQLAEQSGAIFLSGTDKIKVRRQIYETFQHRDDVVLIATIGIASTGLDIPRIFNVIMIDIGKSFTRVIQTIGRGLRLSHDKSSVHVTDICSDLKYSRRHLTSRKQYYTEAEYPFKVHKVKIK